LVIISKLKKKSPTYTQQKEAHHFGREQR